MTAKIDKIAAAIVARVPPVMAPVNDPRIASGELLTEKQVHKFVAGKLERLFKQLRGLCDYELAQECEGRTQAEIRAIMKRKLRTIDFL